MKGVSGMVSTLGLLALVFGVTMLPAQDGLRWGVFGISLAIAMLCFLFAWWLAKRP